MVSIEEIKKLPVFSTMFISSIIGFSLLVPCLILHYFKAALFYKMELFKIILLCGGSGFVAFIVCFWIAVANILLNIYTVNKNTFRDLAVESSMYAFFLLAMGYGAGAAAVSIDWANNINEFCKFGSIGIALTLLIFGIFRKTFTFTNQHRESQTAEQTNTTENQPTDNENSL